LDDFIFNLRSTIQMSKISSKMGRRQHHARRALEATTVYKCCAICGETREMILDVAHLNNDPSNNDPDNLAWLCKNHHRMVDDGLYPIEIVTKLRAEWNRHQGVGNPTRWMKDAGAQAARTRKRRSAAKKAVAERRRRAAAAEPQ
jgi:hypothetical protein